MKQNVLLSMLAMTVPMAAFADANVPTAQDVYSSAGGFVTFDVSLVPGDYTIAAKPTKGETVKVMVDGKVINADAIVLGKVKNSMSRAKK